MKLAYKYRRHSIFTLIVVVLLGCVSQFYIYRYAIHRTTDDVLCEYRIDIEEFVEQTGSLLPFTGIEWQHSYLRTAVVPISNDKIKVSEMIYDSLIYNRHEDQFIVYRVLNFPIKSESKNYIVTLVLPTLEHDDMVTAVVISSSVLLLLFFMTLFLSRRYIDRLTRPLYKLLDSMRSYDARKHNRVELAISDIDEFNELNDVLYSMMMKIENDYKSLKEMAENTSHELQTPLTILRMKLEQLQQSCVESEENMQAIVAMQNVLHRMARFNTSLLLITRISNDSFNERESVSINEMIDNFISLHDEILEAMSLAVVKHTRGVFVVQLHRMLAQVLIDNVLSNTLKYSKKGSSIVIDIDEKSLIVTNTYSNKIPKGDLFVRYNRSRDYENSTGLGMPIIREICIKNGLEVTVEHTDALFSLTIMLPD
ncbi:MAG: GHKL domain-containing protein, partial [Rikenellaceae bacterium]